MSHLSWLKHQSSLSTTNLLTSIPVTEKQRQATFPRCPCNVTTSFPSWSFHTLTDRSQEPVACGEEKERRGDAAHAERLKTSDTERVCESYHTLRVWGEDAALDSCGVTPQLLKHLTTLKHQTLDSQKHLVLHEDHESTISVLRSCLGLVIWNNPLTGSTLHHNAHPTPF